MYYHSLDQIAELFAHPAALDRQRHFEVTSGLPWNLTIGSLKDRYGVEVWRNFKDVVFLPAGSPILGLPSVRFHHTFGGSNLNWPCVRFEGNFDQHGDYSRNHHALIDFFTRQYGFDPDNQDVSNCLCANWGFGLFQIQLHSFIREESNFGSNQLFDTYPELWDSTFIAVEAIACADRSPDLSLPAAMTNGFTIDRSVGGLGSGHFLFNRLRPSFGTPADGYRFWRDDTRLGVANDCAALALPRTLAKGLLLTETEPGRSGASCRLDLQADGLHTIGLLFRQRDMTGLREVAAQASRLYDLPLVTQRLEGDS